MEAVIETAAQTIFETWGGPWVQATEYRKHQARGEALKILEAIKSHPEQAAALVEFLTTADMGDLSAA